MIQDSQMESSNTNAKQSSWLLLIHQLPPKPDYFRVKIWRHLQKLGAVAVKNSVYILPNTDASYESFQWVTREIAASGGEASVCEASFVNGLSDQQIEELFNKASNAEYEQLAKDLRLAAELLPPRKQPNEEQRARVTSEIIKIRKRLNDIVATDFFGASGREAVDGVIQALEVRIQSGGPEIDQSGVRVSLKELQGRIWVTRKGIHVDRMASAWLIRRFIDSKARFKFVDGKSYKPAKSELRFDMFEAEFTHEGDDCTFEVLQRRTNLKDSALREIAEIIHDIDLRDEKFGREDVPGIERLINGIAMAHKEDLVRLERASFVFDDLYEYFKRKKK
jgi:hypothetical protein